MELYEIDIRREISAACHLGLFLSGRRCAGVGVLGGEGVGTEGGYEDESK